MTSHSRKIPPHLKLAFWHFCADVAEEKLAKEQGKGRDWTPEEAERMIFLRGQGATWKEIGEALNRTGSSVATQYRNAKNKKIGVYKIPNNRWTPEQVETMLNMRIAGYKFYDIAKQIDRSESACKCKMAVLRQSLAE